MPELLQVQAATLVAVGLSISYINAYKLWRNHELRRGMHLARWFGIAAGVLLVALYFSFIFQAVSAIPEFARTIFIIVAFALLIFSVTS